MGRIVNHHIYEVLSFESLRSNLSRQPKKSTLLSPDFRCITPTISTFSSLTATPVSSLPSRIATSLKASSLSNSLSSGLSQIIKIADKTPVSPAQDQLTSV